MQTESPLLGNWWALAAEVGAKWLTTPSEGGGQIVYYTPPQEDNTMTYVGIGVAAVAGIGLIWALTKKKKR